MKSIKNSPFLKTAALALLFGAGTFASARAEDENEVEEKVELSALPAAVQDTIQAQVKANDAELGEIVRETEGDKVEYEALITLKNGNQLEVSVAADGSLDEIEKADAAGSDQEADSEDDD